MRNYIKITTQVVVFNELFTGLPIAVIAVGENEEDLIPLMDVAITDAQAQFPGSQFGATDTDGPTPNFYELNKHVLARALYPTIAGVIAQGAIQAGGYLLVSYQPGARAEFDLDPAFFARYLVGKSPRKTWSHGH